MFGYMLLKKGGNLYKTPQEFQQRAREDIENHLRKFSTSEYLDDLTKDGVSTTKNININSSNHSLKSPLINSHTQIQNTQKTLENEINDNTNKSSLTYKSSPLRNTLEVSTTAESSDECSSIDSGKSGCSLSHESAQILLHQQQESLSRLFSRNSTLQNSLFTNDINSLYTSTTTDTNPTINQHPNNNVLTLNEALPKDFTDYYSPDLESERFSNGRPIFTRRPLKNWELNDLRSLLIYPEVKPEWHNKIPEVTSPYPNIHFRIQIIPNYFEDTQIIQYLTHSDIYKEAKLDMEFREKTAAFIVQRARVRHRQILIDSFGVNPTSFHPETHLVGDINFDCYFKFEWRNIIENYLLNLGIENECRLEFKSRISKLKKLTHDKRSFKNKSNISLKNNLYKKVLIENKSIIDESLKVNIWKEVKSDIYKILNMNSWEVT